MKAMISGQAGLALILDGESCWSISADDPNQKDRCCAESARVLFGGANDVCVWDDSSESAVRNELVKAWARDRALQMVLILLDATEDPEIRQMAGECFEERLQQNDVVDFVANRLFESPLPEAADLDLALHWANEFQWLSTGSLLTSLQQHQRQISAVRAAFDSIDDGVLDLQTDESRDGFRRRLADIGVFRRLALRHGSSLGGEVMSLLTEPAIKSVRQSNKLLTAWAAPLKKPLPAIDVTKVEPPPVDRDASETKVKQRSTYEKRQLVARQLREVLDLFDRGEDATAVQWATDIYNRQTSEGDGAFAVMSMCSLAIAMKRKGDLSHQLHFATIAAESPHADAQAYCQLADALFNLYRFPEALQQYDNTIARFADDVVAFCGRAEVLRELNRLDEALQQYDVTIARFRDDVVARNGRAEVLRELNRLDEALQQYDDTIARFGDDVVARSGRAEVLRELNRLDDALQQYDDTIARLGDSVVTFCGRAEVLRELNRLDDALQQYADTIARFGDSVVAFCGRAEVLRELNRLDDALQQYDDTIARFGDSAVAFCGRAEVLRELNRLDDALQQYDDTIARFGDDVVARNGRAEVLRELNRLDEALQQYDDTISRFRYNLVAKNGRIVVLMQLQQIDEALKSALQISKSYPADWRAQHTLGMAYLQAGDLKRASEVFYDGASSAQSGIQRADFLIGLATVRLRQNRVSEAIELIETIDVVGDLKSALADSIRIHAFGQQKKTQLCTQYFARIAKQKAPLIVFTRDLLYAGFLGPNADAARTETWQNSLFRAEEELLRRIVNSAFGTWRSEHVTPKSEAWQRLLERTEEELLLRAAA